MKLARVSLESLKVTHTETDVFVSKTNMSNYQDLFPFFLEDKEGCQWTFHSGFVEPVGVRAWEDYLHFKLYYVTPERLVLLLTSEDRYKREHASIIAKNKKLVGY